MKNLTKLERFLSATAAAFCLGLATAYYNWAEHPLDLLMFLWLAVAAVFTVIAAGKGKAPITAIKEEPRRIRFRGIGMDALTPRLSWSSIAVLAALPLVVSACVGPVRERTRVEYAPPAWNDAEAQNRARAAKQGVGEWISARLNRGGEPVMVTIDPTLIINGYGGIPMPDEVKAWAGGLVRKGGGLPVERRLGQYILEIAVRVEYDNYYDGSYQIHWAYGTFCLKRVLQGGGVTPELCAIASEPMGGYRGGYGDVMAALARMTPCAVHDMKSGDPGNGCGPQITRLRLWPW